MALEDYSGSGHQYVAFVVLDGDLNGSQRYQERQPRWNFERMGSAKFAEVLAKGPDATDGPPINKKAATVSFVASTVTLITAACKPFMLQKAFLSLVDAGDHKFVQRDASNYARKCSVPGAKLEHKNAHSDGS